MIWTADKLIYRGQENFIRAFSGDTKVWERTKSPSLIFSATGAQTVSLTNNNGNAPSLEYSYDGYNWSAWTYTALSFGTTEHPQVYVRGKNIAGFSQSSSIYSKFAFGNSTSVDVSGNVMALINWENVPNTIPSNYCFYSLFNGATALKSVSTLPATTLTDGCYSNMFYGCTNLTTAPTLPASEVKSVSYASMFRNCTALRIAPSLPATTLGTYCYSQMFDGCTALVVPPTVLPATTSMQGCYEYMFRDCRNMTSAPALSATNAANRCYQYMFSGCRSLTSIDYNYLPATTVADRAYQCMFQGCSIVKAPELPATTVGYLSYAQMFQGCSSLNEIHCLATALTASNKSTENWVYGVASAGTFYGKNKEIWPIDSVSGVPIGWTSIFENAITAITFNSLIWVTDIPASGGTATSANCSYSIYGINRTGGTTDITTACTVTGSLEVEPSTATTRQSVGLLHLTATYNSLSASESIIVYQAPNDTKYLLTSPTAITINYTGGTAVIAVNSNVDWECYVTGDTVPYTELWYETYDNNKLTLPAEADFGATIISHTYENGKGIIRCNGTITKIDGEAFNGDKVGKTKVKYIRVPETVTYIGDYSLQANYALLTYEIPKSVTRVGTNFLSNATSLEYVTFLSKTPLDISTATNFMSTTNNCTIYVPASSVNAYKTAWPKFSSRIQPLQ